METVWGNVLNSGNCTAPELVEGLNWQPIMRRSQWYWYGSRKVVKDSPAVAQSSDSAKMENFEKWEKRASDFFCCCWTIQILPHGTI